MNQRQIKVATLALLTSVLSGCVVYAGGHGGRHGEGAGYRGPAGHKPPPGSCRIWYPDRPAGHQPPPRSCSDLQYQVPPGAILIRG